MVTKTAQMLLLFLFTRTRCLSDCTENAVLTTTEILRLQAGGMCVIEINDNVLQDCYTLRKAFQILQNAW